MEWEKGTQTKINLFYPKIYNNEKTLIVALFICAVWMGMKYHKNCRYYEHPEGEALQTHLLFEPTSAKGNH